MPARRSRGQGAPELAGPVTGVDGELCFVGPALAPRPEPCAFSREFPDGLRPLILVSLGTANADAGERLLAASVAALA